MELDRGVFQGVWNVLRFNWHFYALAFGIGLLAGSFTFFFTGGWQVILYLLFVLSILPAMISLGVSFYVYDLSDLYLLKWLDGAVTEGRVSILNVNAGFDETSRMIEDRFPLANLQVCDFYDPVAHTEASIQRARKAYPPHPKTQKVPSFPLPYPDNSFDIVCVVFSAHEIRDALERVRFFRELKRIIKTSGKVFITEHLRDSYNFMAYTLGFFHFYSQATWKKTFQNADLDLEEVIKSTPFVNTFMLQDNGTTS